MPRPSARPVWSALARMWDHLLGSPAAFTSPPPPPASRPVKLGLLPLEDRVVPDGRPLPLPFVFAGTQEAAGTPARARAYDAETGVLLHEWQPFGAEFTGGVRTAAGDIDHDGIPDLIAAAGPGGGPHVRVYSGKSGEQIDGPLGSFYAYTPNFSGGVWVASGDVDGDGWADLLTAAGAGGGPHVKAFSGATGQLLANFYAYAPDFRGGASITAADLTGDGKAELITGAGAGGGPHVKAFDLNAPGGLTEVRSFYAYDPSFTGGVEIAGDFLAGDVTGDGVTDIVTGAGAGGGPHVKVFDGVSSKEVRSFYAFDPSFTGGVRVATAFVNNDKYADIVVGSGSGRTGTVKVFSGTDATELAAPMSPYTPFAGYTGGLYVAASNDPPVEEEPGGPPEEASGGSGGDMTVWITGDQDASEAGVSAGWFTVHRSSGTGTLTVNYSAPTGTATLGGDYTGPASGGGSVSFANGETAKRVYVEPIDDVLVEGTETVGLSLASGGGYILDKLGKLGFASVNLYDNDGSSGGSGGEVGVWVTADSDASEAGASAGWFTVHRSNGAGTLTVNYAAPTGAATLGSDYTGLASGGGTVSFANGVTEVSVYITPVDDSLIEGTETVELSLASGGGYTVGSPGGASLDLLDNDGSSGGSGGAPHVWVTASADAAEAGGFLGWFTVHRTSGSGTLTVNYSAPTGTATLGSDYIGLASGGTVTFADGQTETQVYVQPVDDTAVEGTETVVFNLASGGGYTTGLLSSATVRLYDNDFGSSGGSGGEVGVWITADQDAHELDESSGWFTVRRSSGAGTLTVNYAAPTGTATLGTDYTGLASGGGTITFADGETEKWVFVDPVDDLLVEGTETVELTLLSGAGYSVGSPGWATVQIDDHLGAGGAWSEVWVSGSFDGEERSDGLRPVVFELSRSNPMTNGLSSPLYIAYTLSGTATTVVDYEQPNSFAAMFAPGEATTTVVLPVLVDALTEGSETVTIQLEPLVGVIPGQSSATATVYDPGTLPPVPPVPPPATLPEVWVSTSFDGEEQPNGLRPVVFQLSRSNPNDPDTAPALTVSFSLSGEATPGGDYDAPSAYTATFAPGELTTTVVLGVVHDAIDEGDESVILTLTPGSAYTVGEVGSGWANISDSGTGVVSGTIWQDTVTEFNIRQWSEPVLADVGVSLYRDGTLLSTTYTNADGRYSFDRLRAGNYEVRVTVPLPMRPVTQDYGGNDYVDSDVNADGWSDPIPLLNGQLARRDAGLAQLLKPEGFDDKNYGILMLNWVNAADRWGGKVVNASELKVAKWEKSFTSNRNGTPALMEPAQNGYDFIDLDVDRFFVLVKDKPKYNAGVQTFNVEIKTQHVGTALQEYNDSATEIPVVLMGEDYPGWYVSDSQLLVSNETDDLFTAAPTAIPGDNVRKSGGVGTDEAAPSTAPNAPKNSKKFIGGDFREWVVSDRTHRVALTGEVVVSHPTEAGIEAKSPVRVRKSVGLHINIMRDTVGGTAATTEAAVLADVKQMNEIYAQIGLQVRISVPIPVAPKPDISDPPAGAGLDTPAPGRPLNEPSLNSFGVQADPNPQVNKFWLLPSAEEKALAGSLRSDPSVLQDIEVYYVYRLSAGNGGEALARNFLQPGDQPFADTVFVATVMRVPPLNLESPRLYLVTAHEVGHILEDLANDSRDLTKDKSHFPHTGAPPTIKQRTNLMVSGRYAIVNGEGWLLTDQGAYIPDGFGRRQFLQPLGPSIFDSRRLTADQEYAMLYTRTDLVTGQG